MSEIRKALYSFLKTLAQRNHDVMCKEVFNPGGIPKGEHNLDTFCAKCRATELIDKLIMNRDEFDAEAAE